jgi:hypothetical protein
MIETKLKEALIRFNGGIKAADGAAISVALNEVEALLTANRAELHPRLVHFLEGRSYAKALEFLGGDGSALGQAASPPGGCGGDH